MLYYYYALLGPAEERSVGTRKVNVFPAKLVRIARYLLAVVVLYV
jgi:hypothetical protein